MKAALIRGERGSALLPIWFGPGMQFVPDQGAIHALTIVVPLVHDGADPWRIDAGRRRVPRAPARRRSSAGPN